MRMPTYTYYDLLKFLQTLSDDQLDQQVTIYHAVEGREYKAYPVTVASSDRVRIEIPVS